MVVLVAVYELEGEFATRIVSGSTASRWSTLEVGKGLSCLSGLGSLGIGALLTRSQFAVVGVAAAGDGPLKVSQDNPWVRGPKSSVDTREGRNKT